MNKKELLFLSALITSCRDEKAHTLEQLPIPKLEVHIPQTEEAKPSDLVEEKVQPKGIACTIDLSNRFIPELMALSRDAQLYFSTDGSLQNPLQRERFGIFSSFAHHQKSFEHYVKAIGRRGDQKQPKIELTFVPYTSEKTVKKISYLEEKLHDQTLSERQREQTKRELETLRIQIQEVKDTQQILQWEDYYKGEITGIYDAKTSNAMMRYQKYHRERLINPVMFIAGIPYELKADGSINKPTRELLNKSFEEHAFGGVKRVLEERVFHAKCNGRYPYVIEQPELDKLVSNVAEQVNLDTIEGVKGFFSKEHGIATVYLEIPERYQRDYMKLEIEIEKWEKSRTKSKLRLYSIENEERIELFQTRVVVGGKVKNKKTGRKKDYNTPEREFYLKHSTILPHWNPPEWAAQEEEVKEEEKLPGPFNAFGMLNSPLYYDNKPQKDPFRAWQEGDNGYRIHLTPWPSSVENGGASHGCIRVHPNRSRFFYFITGYTPHKIVLEDYHERKTLKFTSPKGSFIPFEPEHYIKVQICEKKCEKINILSRTL